MRPGRPAGGRTSHPSDITASRGTTKTSSSSLIRLRPRGGAGRRPAAPRRPSASGPPSRSSSAEPAVERVAQRRGAARRSPSAFVAMMPAPISTSPRASLVIPCQPPAASGPRPASPAGRPSPPGDRLDERRRDDERQVADRGDGGVVLGGRHLDGRAPQARAGPRPARDRPAGARSPGRRPTAGRRTGPPSTAS